MRLLAVFFLVGATDLIDRSIAERWKAEGLAPAPVSDDYEFLRRLSIDLRGRIPASGEVRAFAADRDPRKREKIVDGWLEGAEFAEHWAFLYAETLGLSIQFADRIHEYHDGFRAWLRDALRSNMPYDRLARRIVTARGPTDLDPAAVFLMGTLIESPDGPRDAVERLGRMFLGAQLRCAECHDHPFDDWTRDDFHAMTSFFWQTKADGKKTKNGFIGWLEEEPSRGEPSTDEGSKAGARSHPPAYKATGDAPRKGEERRAAFARMLVADPQFARAAVNRHWGMLFGRGFVQPLDGFAAGRKPSHPALLDALAKEFVRSNYDVRALLKSMLLSRPYQLSSRGDADPAADRLFARAQAAPLSPEQLFNSVMFAAGLEDRPLDAQSKIGPRTLREAFLREFRPANLSPNAKAPNEPTLAQALFLLNGDITARGASAGGQTRLAGILSRFHEPHERIEELYLSTLSRPPAPREKEAILNHVKKAGPGPRVYEDVFWALINSTEFATRR